MGAFRTPLPVASVPPLRDISQFGVGKTSVVFVLSLKTCSRSVVLGEEGVGGGGCETIVVCSSLPFSDVLKVVVEISSACTEVKVVVDDEACTTMLKVLGAVVSTLTVIGCEEASSSRIVTIRSHLSPPNRRDASETQGDMFGVFVLT
jgi:hypothetical protein